MERESPVHNTLLTRGVENGYEYIWTEMKYQGGTKRLGGTEKRNGELWPETFGRAATSRDLRATDDQSRSVLQNSGITSRETRRVSDSTFDRDPHVFVMYNFKTRRGPYFSGPGFGMSLLRVWRGVNQR